MNDIAWQTNWEVKTPKNSRGFDMNEIIEQQGKEAWFVAWEQTDQLNPSQEVTVQEVVTPELTVADLPTKDVSVQDMVSWLEKTSILETPNQEDMKDQDQWFDLNKLMSTEKQENNSNGPDVTARTWNNPSQ